MDSKIRVAHPCNIKTQRKPVQYGLKAVISNLQFSFSCECNYLISSFGHIDVYPISESQNIKCLRRQRKILGLCKTDL